MTKEEARQRLTDWINGSCFYGDIFMGIDLPIHDLNIMDISSPEPKIATTLEEQDKLNDRPYEIKQYSFRHLLKVAYDLEDKK